MVKQYGIMFSYFTIIPSQGTCQSLPLYRIHHHLSIIKSIIKSDLIEVVTIIMQFVLTYVKIRIEAMVEPSQKLVLLASIYDLMKILNINLKEPIC